MLRRGTRIFKDLDLFQFNLNEWENISWRGISTFIVDFKQFFGISRPESVKQVIDRNHRYQVKSNNFAMFSRSIETDQFQKIV